MPLSLAAPEDLVNDALVRTGIRWRVGSLYDGSPPAKCALDIYSQTRDELLRSEDWGFAERDLSLLVLKTAPPGGYFPPTTWNSTYPIPPWRYEYAYPVDCLKVRAIRPQPLIIPEPDPRPHVWRLANDASLLPPAQVILTDVVQAILVYTGQVTNPLLWEPLFVETLIAALSRRLAPALATLDLEKLEGADEAGAKMMAAEKQG